MILNQVDEEAKAKEAGYRNFASFVGLCYYGRKLSLNDCGKLIGISRNKMKTSMVKRGFSIRRRGPVPGSFLGVKRRKVNFDEIIKAKTSFIFPWCVLHVYYERYFLTTKEIGLCLGVSQTFVCKLLKKYKIHPRKRGKAIL